MANYVGRTNQAMEVQNFLGINSKSSIVSSKDGEAIDIKNWDIDLSGAITRRHGNDYKSGQAGNNGLIDSYIGFDGVTYYVMQVSSSSVARMAISPNLSTLSPHAYDVPGWAGLSAIGDSLNGYYYITAPGGEPYVIDKPSVTDFFTNQYTSLKQYSKVSEPTDMAATAVGASFSSMRTYAVSATTVRGETLLSNQVSVLSPAVLNATSYVSLSWVPPVGAYSIHVWRMEADGYFRRIDDGTLAGGTTAFIDNGATADPFSYAPTVNDAYNTPADWEANGAPKGFFAIAIGKENRLLAWRDNTVWASAAGNPSDWYSPNDAFSFQLAGAQDNRVTGIATLMDYTIVFTRTNCFIYSGSNYADWTLVKIQNTGCPSHKSIVNVGDDVYIWGQNGPTSIKRILSGADIESVGISIKISDKVFGLTDTSKWDKIAAVHDIKRQRVIWSVDCLDGVKRALAFNYQVNGWTIHTECAFVSAMIDPYSQHVYAFVVDYGAPTGAICDIYTLNQDEHSFGDPPTTPVNYYKTVFYDLRTWQNKRMLWLDVLMDPSNGPYTCNVTVNWDYSNPMATETHALSYDGTYAYTDGNRIEQQGAGANIHRIFTTGDRRAVQFVFEDAGIVPARVLAWRGEFRVKGVR